MANLTYAHWGETYAEDFCGLLIDKLSPDTRSLMLAYTAEVMGDSGNPWTYGTACSGTDSPSWAYKEFKAAIGRASGHKVSMHCYHLISAEISEEKRKFIRIAAPDKPWQLFGCMFDTVRETVENHMKSTDGEKV